MNDDMELVRQYAADQSGQAFETLVTRYVNLVYSAAVRQVGDPHWAEELTQVVFIILARKAAGLGPRTILPSWLYRTARYVAADALKTERRRAHYEHEAHMQTILNEATNDTAPAEDWAQIAPLLDRAMDRLGEKDHAALVLRFFENRNFREVGTALGASEEAAKMRVNRALDKLRNLFSKQGIHSTTAIIAGTISANSVGIAPATLAKSVSATAITKGAASSASTLTLVKGALKLMAWTNAKTVITAGAIVILGAGTTTIAVRTVFAPVTIKDAYVRLYSEPNYGGEVLTDLPWEAPSNSIAARGDIEDFDGLPSDNLESLNFNDKASSAVYLLPKGCDVILYEAARFDLQQFKLVGTGKIETIPDFNLTHPGFDGIASSLHWDGIKEKAWLPPPVDFAQFEKTPGFILTSEAVRFLVQRLKQGRLPGFPEGDVFSTGQKGSPTLALIPISGSTFGHGGGRGVRTNLPVYPVSRNVVARKNSNELSIYHFSLVKTSATNDWQLTRAWREGTNGTIAEEYPVP